MPITLNETILSPDAASRFLPRRRRGKPVHPSTLYRWMNRGFRGVFLESIRVGGTQCTSREALQRFFVAIANIPPDRDPTSVFLDDP